MRERPILFSAPMVRAILDGTKTQTRRVVKPPHQNPLGEWEPTQIGGADGGRTATGETVPEQGAIWHTRMGDVVACPYGQPGDRLWVRETFSPFAIYSAPVRIDAASYAVLADGTQVYRDGAIVPGLAEYAPGAADHIRWRPSIHMPRWASRITLEVTSVRVERLHAITEFDAIAEGVEPEPGMERWRNYVSEFEGVRTTYVCARDSFFSLWESINGVESLAANPWVWVVGFKRVEVPRG